MEDEKVENDHDRDDMKCPAILSSEDSYVHDKFLVEVISLEEQDERSLVHSVGAVMTRRMAKELSNSREISLQKLPSPPTIIVSKSQDCEKNLQNKILNWHEKHYHLKATRLWNLLKLTSKDPPTRAQVEAALKNCKLCKKLELLNSKAAELVPCPDQPGMSVSVDYFCPFGFRADKRGYTACLVIQDTFSKMTLVIPCMTHSRDEVVYHLQIYTQTNAVPRDIILPYTFSECEYVKKFLKRSDIRAIFKPSRNERSPDKDSDKFVKSPRDIIHNIIKYSKIPVSEWSDACQIVAEFINTTPDSEHGLCPIAVHRGYLSHYLLEDGDISVSRHTKKIWRDVKAKLEAQSQRQIHLSKKLTMLQEGTKVYLLLGEKNSRIKKVPAKVIIDYGSVILAEKENCLPTDRFRTIPVHKSQVTLRFDDK